MPSELWTTEWMAEWTAWISAARWGYNWVFPLALAMVAKKAAERAVLWARKKAEKWDVYLDDCSVAKPAVLLAACWADSSVTLKMLFCLINSSRKRESKFQHMYLLVARLGKTTAEKLKQLAIHVASDIS